MRTSKDWDNYLVFGIPLPPLEETEVPVPIHKHKWVDDIGEDEDGGVIEGTKCEICGIMWGLENE